MLTINSSFPVLMIGSKVLRVRKIYKNMHMPQFFQPMLLNSKFLYKRGALPCAGKHSCTSSKKNVLKSLFVLMSPCIVNKPVNCQYLYQRKEKRYFVGSFFKPYGPMCILVKMVILRPALYFLKSLPTFKALTVIAGIMQSSALPMRSYALSVLHRMFC